MRIQMERTHVCTHGDIMWKSIDYIYVVSRIPYPTAIRKHLRLDRKGGLITCGLYSIF